MVSRIRRAKIREIASELLVNAKVHSPPVPVDRIAKMCDARIKYMPLDSDISGILSHDEGKAIIGVNTSHPSVRQRFTIAHELGHLSLHREGMFIDRKYPVLMRNERSSEANDFQEIEANTFAAELLMPAEMLEHDLVGYTVEVDEGDEFIRELARTYEVSLQAMIFRLANLGYHDMQ